MTEKDEEKQPIRMPLKTKKKLEMEMPRVHFYKFSNMQLVMEIQIYIKNIKK